MAQKFGGIEAIEPLNKEKASLLYDAIDNSSLLRGTAKKEDRSIMNVSFVAANAGAEKAFLDFAKRKDIYGIKGHRLVGGFRASLYNAVSLDSVKHLISVIKEFESGYNG